MDFNGLADPYVKLHLLPGACKVWFYYGSFVPAFFHNCKRPSVACYPGLLSAHLILAIILSCFMEMQVQTSTSALKQTYLVASKK